jgi:hypothetical protein
MTHEQRGAVERQLNERGIVPVRLSRLIAIIMVLALQLSQLLRVSDG